MNPITHFLISANVSQYCDLDQRDAILVTTGGIICDLDGLGAVGDFFFNNQALITGSGLYARYHHILCHNIAFCLVCTFFVYLFSKRKFLTSALFALTFHLHLLCDILGSGGGDGYRWPIPYLYPFSMTPQLEWAGQWELASWQNSVITLVFIVTTLMFAQRKGSSPLGWISKKADKALIDTLRKRFPLADDK